MNRDVITPRFYSNISRYLVAFLCVTGFVACGGSGGDSNTPNNESEENAETQENAEVSEGFDQRNLLINSANIINDAHQDADSSISTLQSQIANYCSQLGQPGEQVAKTSAQTAFATAMDDVQRVLMYGTGPALDEQKLVQLYSWPLTSHCQLDLKLANNESGLTVAVDRRGLDAIEYLLFSDDAANHSCPDNFIQLHPVLTSFNALSATDKQARRCATMMKIVDDAASIASNLAVEWRQDGGDYVTTLGQTAIASEGLNQVTDALFYFEKVVKENKLDAPLGGGITNTIPSCGAGEPCPVDVESPTAKRSKENIIANMTAFQQMYHGSDSTADGGFKAWLIDQGEADMAALFETHLQAIIDDFNAIDGSMYDAISTDLEAMNTLLQGPVQNVSRALRYDILPALGLSLPAGSASDTD